MGFLGIDPDALDQFAGLLRFQSSELLEQAATLVAAAHSTEVDAAHVNSIMTCAKQFRSVAKELADWANTAQKQAAAQKAASAG